MGLGAGDGLRARCPECGDGKWELRTEEGQRGEEGEEEARRNTPEHTKSRRRPSFRRSTTAGRRNSSGFWRKCEGGN